MSLTSNHVPEVIDAINGADLEPAPEFTPPKPLAYFVEALPARKSSKRSGIRWTPTLNDGPAAGVLVIDTDRTRTTYTLCEFPSDWPGRAFTLSKVEPESGSDKTEERYAVYCGPHGQRLCECKGFHYAGHCKHSDSIDALIENRWV